MDQKTIDNDYTYHKPEGDDQAKYTALRAKAKELAELIQEVCPSSREQSLAHTNLQTAVMWANASISRNGKAPEKLPFPQPNEVTPAHSYPKHEGK